MRLRDVPDGYAHCRAWGHSWSFTTVDKIGGEYTQGLRCANCGTERYVKISARTGYRDPNSRYSYPEDQDQEAVPYKMPHGSGGQLTVEERAAVTLDEIKSRYRGNGHKRN